MQIPFVSKLQGGKLVAVFDVGSGSVGAAIAELRGARPVLIHSSFRVALPHEERSQEQLASAIAQATQESATKLAERHAKSGVSKKEISECLVVVHAPWVRSQTHATKALLKEEAEVIEDMIIQLSQKALTEGENALGDIFEQSVVRVELNGYPTSLPLNKKAKSLGVVILQSEVTDNMIRRVTDGISKIFPGAFFTFRSSTLVDSALMRRRSPGHSHFTIADVTSEATAITVVCEGVVVVQKVVPVGYRTVVRSVAQKKGTPDSDVHSRIRMLTTETCSTDDCHSLQASLDGVGTHFTETFGTVFAEINKTKKLPNTLVVRSHPDLKQWFSKFFARLDFAQFTETTQPFEVGAISSGAAAEYVLFSPGNTLDAGIATSCAFLYTGRNDPVGNLMT